MAACRALWKRREEVAIKVRVVSDVSGKWWGYSEGFLQGAQHGPMIVASRVRVATLDKWRRHEQPPGTVGGFPRTSPFIPGDNRSEERRAGKQCTSPRCT